MVYYRKGLNTALKRGTEISIVYLLGCLPHGLEDVGHLLPLPLGPHVLTDPLLQELQATLVLVDPEELHGPALVGREPRDLPDEVPDELVARGDLALGARRLLLERVGGRLVTLVLAHHQLVTGSHDACCLRRRAEKK